MLKIKLPKGLPRFELVNKRVAKMVNDVADASVKHMVSDVKASKDIQGKNLKKLKPSTIKQKLKKGYSAKPLIATGKMINILKSKKASSSNLTARVDVGKGTKEIAEYHITGAGNLPKRVFFGVGKTLEGKLTKIINLRIEKLIKVVMRKVKSK